MKQNQKGFTLAEGLLIVIAVTLIGFTGWYVWSSQRDPEVNKTENAPSSSESAKTDTANPTAGWKTFTSSAGKYTLRYPGNWVTTINQAGCEDDSLLFLGPTRDTVGRCGSDYGGMIMFNSFSVESGPMNLTNEYYHDIKNQEVTVNGIKGERQSGIITNEPEGIGPAKGTIEIVYIFRANGLIYKADYSQQPNNPDIQKEFDLIVTSTLEFN